MKLLLLALLLLPPDGDRLRMRVHRDTRQMTTVTVLLAPAENDRHLFAVATSENVIKDSYRQLEGLQSRGPYTFTWRLPDDGIYVIEVSVGDNQGAITASTQARLVTMPREGQ